MGWGVSKMAIMFSIVSQRLRRTADFPGLALLAYTQSSVEVEHRGMVSIQTTRAS